MYLLTLTQGHKLSIEKCVRVIPFTEVDCVLISIHPYSLLPSSLPGSK